MIELKLVDVFMDETLSRLKSGLYFDNNLKPYRKDFLETVLNFYQEKERYEECSLIRDLIKNRFNHDDVSNFRNF
jgi:hypothetical protein